MSTDRDAPDTRPEPKYFAGLSKTEIYDMAWNRGYVAGANPSPLATDTPGLLDRLEREAKAISDRGYRRYYS